MRERERGESEKAKERERRLEESEKGVKFEGNHKLKEMV